MSTEDRLVQKAKALVESIDFDNNGVMVGNVFRGGNGGMISLKTIRAADELRKALDAYRRQPSDLVTSLAQGKPSDSTKVYSTYAEAARAADRLNSNPQVLYRYATYDPDGTRLVIADQTLSPEAAKKENPHEIAQRIGRLQTEGSTMNNPSVFLRLESIAGCAPRSAIQDAAAIAKSIGIWVDIDINGIEVFIAPDADKDRLYESWSRAVVRKARFCSEDGAQHQQSMRPLPRD